MKINFFPDEHESEGAGRETLLVPSWIEIETDEGMRFDVKQVPGGIEVMVSRGDNRGGATAIVPTGTNSYQLVNTNLYRVS